MFKLEFSTENEWFHGASLDAAVAAVLALVRTRIVQGETRGTIRDRNGNAIGSFTLEAPDHG